MVKANYKVIIWRLAEHSEGYYHQLEEFSSIVVCDPEASDAEASDLELAARIDYIKDLVLANSTMDMDLTGDAA